MRIYKAALVVVPALFMVAEAHAQNTVMPALSPEELKQFNSQPLSPKISVPELDGTQTGPTRNSRMKNPMKPGTQSSGEQEAEILGGDGDTTPATPQITKSF
ncbi:hypothetical protein G6655_00050 [Polynucleobacter paneuropaeus]|nr:hypothetical protein [Polynucleobacter paneuropaeus]